MKNVLFLIVSASLVCFVHAHTHEENLRFIHDALMGALTVASDDNWSAEGRNPDPDGVLSSWEGFLGTDGDGWSFEERRIAFDCYLDTLATTNCDAFSNWDKRLVRVAYSRCKRLSYTNAVPALRRAAQNPHGVYRSMAIDVGLSLGNVDSSATDFVKSIVTNISAYTRSERGMAIGAYAEKLMTVGNLGASQVSNRLDAVHWLYNHREADVAGANMLDNLFADLIDGYVQSSNRLEYACFILDHPDCRSGNACKFVSVTNQLLSSGQPLRQLNIGEAGE